MSKILIIENDENTASKAAVSLKDGLDGVNICISLSGIEGLKNLKRKSFDLVIAESRLADMNGFDLLKGMAEIGGHWPTIILSVPGRGEEAVKYMRKGVYDYIVKDSDFPNTIPRAAQRALDLSYIFNEKRNLAETNGERLRRKELSRIAHVLNHEVNNPLMAIIGNVQLLLSKSEIDPQELREKLEAIEDSARRIARVTAFFADSDINTNNDLPNNAPDRNAILT
ncbi:MAG: response regulator [Candidatus Zixiibacteriota bacterium]|nr:MAG: response regulator [candidate division Zixibacteria bacterium]